MLWYKAWLETRARFLLCLAGTTGICGYRVFDLAREPASFGYLYVMHTGSDLLTVTWLVATTLLAMGGLLQERSAGVSSFTLGMPATRTRMASVRVCVALLEAVALIVVPWAVMFAAATLTGRPGSFMQVVFYAVLLASGGAVFVGAALLVSSLVEGTYSAPLISLGIVIACANAPRSLRKVNPLAFIGGSAYMGPGNAFTGLVPWTTAAAYLCVAAFLIFTSVKVIERRDL